MSRILICADVPDWVWHHQSCGIQAYAPPFDFDVTVCFQQDILDHRTDTQWLRQWDAVMHWAWIDLALLFGINRLVTVVAHDGLRWPFLDNENNTPWHVPWPQWAGSSPQRNLPTARTILPRADHVICVNPDLNDFVSTKFRNGRCEYIPVGIDHNLFVPTSPVSNRAKLRVGWCGQEVGRTKGYGWIMEPLMDRLGDTVDFVINRRGHQDALDTEQMVAWYNSIDVLLCTSISEGTPSPPLEALACGRPVITTPVGDMPNVLGGTEAGILIDGYVNADEANRTIDRFVEVIEGLTSSRVRQMGEAARSRIEDVYTWERLSPKWLAAIVG